MMDDSLGDMSIYELFRLEVDSQIPVVTDALLALESDPMAADPLKTCMRCAHSLKGAARMVELTAGVNVAHVMEECLVAAQAGRTTMTRRHIDALLLGVDLLKRIAYTPAANIEQWTRSDASDALTYIDRLTRLISEAVTPSIAPEDEAQATVQGESPALRVGASSELPGDDRMLRVTAESVNRLLGLAGETLVGSRWFKPFSASLMQLKQMQLESRKEIDLLETLLADQAVSEEVASALRSAKERINACSRFLGERVADLDLFSQREASLAQRLYDEALASRMRPFRDGVSAFPRMVRDMGNAMNKQVSLQIVGWSTLVDRDILAKLEAPLTHLLRNAIDHAIEAPDKRVAAGKSAEAVLQLEAGHRAGRLIVSVTDDGRGIALKPLRERVVAKQLTSAEVAERLSTEELLEFLFLPGFSMKDEVSEYSGRGVGLDVVQHMVKQVHGQVHIESQEGAGTRFRLRLPVATSVVRVLVVEVGGEPYAFPLAYISGALLLDKNRVEQVEGYQHFQNSGVQVGLLTAHQIFQKPVPRFVDKMAVVMIGDTKHPHGLIVDRFLGEQELVVQPLDARLGKIKDILAGAIAEDGTPVLIVDVEDMVHSIGKLVVAGALHRAQGDSTAAASTRKRILLVDDSLTVRELERQLLSNRGYEVEVAVDGVDGWNAARIGHFDLVVSDIDMPRMDGIELVTLMRQHPKLRTTPVVIVSYKDREQDRQRGLDAGADYYLTKGSFHDDRLVEAVVDLIGESTA